MPDHDLSSLVRRYVDGELDAPERRALEARLEEDEALRRAVAFERALAGRVGTLLREPEQAPAGLAERIRAALAATDAAPPRRRLRLPVGWFEGPRRANVAAVAATLLLVAGAVLWGVFGTSIDRMSPAPSPPLIAEAARFVSGEHSRCANDRKARNAKLTIPPGQIAAELERYLGWEPAVADLSEFGYELKGAAHCMVPGPTNSAHIAYIRPPGAGRPGAMASVFVAPDEGQFDIGPALRTIPGHWQEVVGGPECEHRVLTSDDGHLVYFLVCCDEQDIDAIADRVAMAIAEHAPQPPDPSVR